MNTLVKTLLLSVAAAGFSMSAAARDVRHRWCPPEETPAPVTEQPIPQPQVERINLSADALFRFNRSGPNDVLPAGKPHWTNWQEN